MIKMININQLLMKPLTI